MSEEKVSEINAEQKAESEQQTAAGEQQKAVGDTIDQAYLQQLQQIIQSMVGAVEFKELCRELIRITPLIHASKAYRALFFQSFLFAIDDGCGLTTSLHLLRDLVDSLGLYRRKLANAENLSEEQKQQFLQNSVIEIELERSEHLADTETLDLILHNLEQLQFFPQLICFDISSWSFSIHDSRFKQFLQHLNNFQYDCIFVFRVPFLADDVLRDIKSVINDVMFVRSVKFVLPTNQEYLMCAAGILQQHKFQLTADCEEAFYQLIAEEKNDGYFYGLRTVDKLVNQMIYGKLLAMAETENFDFVISQQDIRDIFALPQVKEFRGLDQLDDMVAMDEVKKQLQEYITLVEYQRNTPGDESDDPSAVSMNLQFIGSPGTGKSTVARILARVLKEKGLLTIGNVIEISAQDLCGRYAGETIPKVSAVCRDAFGSVLMIDDPFSLYRGRGNSEMGLEVVETLLAEMNNRGSNMVVILSGVEEDLTMFLENNPAMAPYFNTDIRFPVYSRNELRSIFFQMIEDNAVYDDDFVLAVDNFLKEIPDQQLQSAEFSNARLMRNLYEWIMARASARREINNENEIKLLAEDVSKAVSEKRFKELTEHKSSNRIGFN